MESTTASTPWRRRLRAARWALVAFGCVLVGYGVAVRTGVGWGRPCWEPARVTEANCLEVRARRCWAPAVVAGTGAAIAFVAWPRRPRAAGRFDGRRWLWIPCLEVVFGLHAPCAADWGEAFRALAGPFAWVPTRPFSADLVGAFVVLGVAVWITVGSVTRPFFAWILWLLVWYMIWIGLATPIEWHA
ncbi:MAG: hypothetical protein JNM10_08120 [Planctomycetia bacterium]|nr:hypothetical protein [Planctomycetia bacterium]